MNLYLDTEFNGLNGALLSIALVPADPGVNGFYRACHYLGALDSWVAEHVIPALMIEPIMYHVLRDEFHDYIKGFVNPTIICDWHADAVHFCKLLSGDTYDSSLDYSCTIQILKTPPGQPVSARPHNAYQDACALKYWHIMWTGR